MHLITGMAASMLFSGLRKNTGHNKLLKTDFRVAHASKGRIRIYSQKLQNPKVAEILKKELKRVQGIKEISNNTVTGSFLVLFDSKIIQPDLLASAAYQLLGFAKDKESNKEGRVYKEVESMNLALNHALMEKSDGALDTKTLIAGGFLVLGVRELIKHKSLGMPAPITLFYWAYNTLGLNKPKSSGSCCDES